jgi:hypothetical protein
MFEILAGNAENHPEPGFASFYGTVDRGFYGMSIKMRCDCKLVLLETTSKCK